MRTAVLATGLTLALTSLAVASPVPTSPGSPRPTTSAPALPAGTRFVHRCADGQGCKSLVAVDANGKIIANATPVGHGPADLQKAYNIDPTLGAGTTVALVDAFGYKNIEADLAMYRSTFGLPPCTTASGCLTVVNNVGDPAPLPADDQMWIGETALDVQMVSAACPLCKIIVVQASSAGGTGLDLGQKTASKIGADAISDSWGGFGNGFDVSEEGDFNVPGIGVFVSSGDNGYTGAMPQYPTTSAYVISVGGTTLVKVDPSVNPRGFVEGAWSGAGSSCSTTIPKPAFQPAQVPCGGRAGSDISAVADPDHNSAVAIYVGEQGGWQLTGGTSAASPLAMAIFAAAGHADARPEFVYKHPDIFLDIAQGQNGTCGTKLCQSSTGWDGPTGLGTIDQAKLKAIGGVVGAGPEVAISFPADGATVAAGFTIEATLGSAGSYVTIDIDGTKLQSLNVAPLDVSAPMALADGPHTVTATAFDLDHNSSTAMINIVQGGGSGSGDGTGGGGGCAAGGGAGGAGSLLALGALVVGARRRKSA